MIIIKRDNPQLFGGKAFLMTKQENEAMNTVADAITVNRGPLVELLLAHGMQVSPAASKEELLDAFTEAFKKKEQFRVDFAKLNAKKFSNYGDDSTSMIQEDSEDGNGGFWAGSSGDSSSSDKPKGEGMGAGGYLGLINGIIGGVGGILGLFAKPDSTGAQLNYNQQILMLAAQKEAARRRNNIIAIISVVLVLIGITVGVVMYAKKKKAI